MTAAGDYGTLDAEPPALAGTPETPLATLPWALEANQWERAKVEPDAEEFKPYVEWPLAASTQSGWRKLGSEPWGARPAPGTPEDFNAMEAGALAAFAAGSVAADDHDPLDDTLETARGRPLFWEASSRRPTNSWPCPPKSGRRWWRSFSPRSWPVSSSARTTPN